MGSLLEAATRAVLAAPRRWTVVALALMAGLAFLSTRIQFADDARALIAGADPEVEQQLAALSEFTAVDQLLIQIDARGYPEELLPAARALTRELIASQRFSEAAFELGAERRDRLLQLVSPRRFALDPRDPHLLLEAQALTTRLRAVREALLAPMGIGRRGDLMRDPFGSVGAALALLDAAPGLPGLEVRNGRLASRDGSSLLLLATPKGDPFRGADAHETMTAVHAAREHVARVAPHVRLRPIGAHRFAHDAEILVRRDVHWSAGLTLVCILLIFIAFFRRPRLVLVALPPLLFGALVAGGVAGAWGVPLHGIVLAFSAACLGLSIDYTIHLIAAAAGDGDAEVLLPLAARRIGKSLALAAASTLAGLLVLSTSSIPALRQMAVLAAAAVVGALVGNLIWVPLLLPRLGLPRSTVARGGPWAWLVQTAGRRPAWVIGLALLLALIFGAAAQHTRFDGDLRNFDTHTERAREDEAAFARAFGDPSRGGLALAEAPDLDTALLRADETAAALTALGVRRLLNPTVLAPPSATVARRRVAWCDEGPQLDERFDAAAVAAGFRSGAFAPFLEELAAWCVAPAADPRPALAGFAEVTGRPVVRQADGGVQVAVAFEADPLVLERARSLFAARPEIRVVHRAALNEQLTRLVADDVPRLASWALLAVVLLLALAFRNIGQTARALAPVLLGGVVVVGTLALLDIPIDLMNLCVFPLLAGLGIDYGVLITDADGDPAPDALRERAFSVTVAAATTLAAFGTLAIARYGAIASIGRAVVLAVIACALLALVLPPAMAALSRRDS